VKILYVCHRLPYPPRRGGKIRPFNMIRHLHAQGHEVHVASLARSVRELEEGDRLREYCSEVIAEVIGPIAAGWRMLARLPSPVPSSFGYFRSPALARRIRERCSQTHFDLAFVHCSSAAPYVAGLEGMTKVLDFGDMDSQKWLHYAAFRRFPLSSGFWLEGKKLERSERRLAARFDLCTCTTRAELDSLRALAPGVASDWFPNGVDSEYFRPDGSPYEPDSISFLGRMDYFPNIEAMQSFCADVLPLIRRRRPAARLCIIGADPAPAVLRLARIPGVQVTGYVPDVRPITRRAAVNVAPLRIARGTQNKVLEAMAMGLPVVASTAAARGVDAVPGEHLLAANDPQGFADAVVGLLESAAARARLADAARSRVLSHHSWASSMRRLDALLERAARLHLDSRADATSAATLRRSA
jgi:sugar transferase (PEP-CTERM/EpsH1 system associated)